MVYRGSKVFTDEVFMEKVAETVSKVDANLENVGIDGVEENVRELGYNLLNYKEYLSEQIPVVTGFCLKVVIAVLLFFIGRRIIKWLMKVMCGSLEKAHVDKGVIQFVGSAGKIVLYLLLIFNIAMWLGVEASSIAALLGTAGVTVGLALQGGLGNLAGGVMLLLFKPFQVGDYIVQNTAEGFEGTVYKIEMFYTTLLSVDNKKIIIPNGTLSNSSLVNVTARENRKLEIKIRVSYKADIKKVKELLENLLREDPYTKVDDEMVVFVDELAQDAVIMGLRVWVPTDQYLTTKWRINQKIKEDFDANGIEIPYNQLEVHVREMKEDCLSPKN